MALKIFFVDRYVVYSTNMFKALQKILSEKNKFEVSFLGHDKKFPHKHSNQFIKDAKKIWSYDNYIRKINNYVKKEKPAIIHFAFEIRTFGNIKSGLRFPILLFLLKKQTKTVVTLRNIMIYKYKDEWKVFEDIPYKIPSFILKIFVNIFIKLICRYSDAIIVEYKESKHGLVEYFRIPKEKIHVIQLGVSPYVKPLKTKKSNFEFLDKKIILCFGLISPRKGLEVTIRAFKNIYDKLPNHVLVIAGAPSQLFIQYEKSLKQLVKELKLEKKVVFTGFVENDDIHILFETAEMAIFNYKPMPGATATLLFAMQHSKACVVSNIETFNDILDKSSALFVDPFNEKQLSEALFNLAKQPELREKLEIEIQKIAKNMTWEKTAQKHLDVYKQLIKISETENLSKNSEN